MRNEQVGWTCNSSDSPQETELMPPANDLTMVWLTVLLFVLGMGGLVACRVGERSLQPWLQRCSRWLFFISLLAVAAVTVVLIAAQHGHWALAGTTMMAMIVGGTLDCGAWQERRSI
jgi:predicted MFS family arabinose efflux permease